jgi:C_GCAxxG_C_C family probable redox protein
MQRELEAVSLHGKGCNCAQAVLAVFSADQGLDREMTMRVATGFGGGMGRSGNTCGAVTGACMVLGLSRGMRRAEDAAAKESTYALVAEFCRQFMEKHATLVCRELLGVDIGTAKGLEAARDRGLFTSRCNDLIRDAVVILEKMLEGGDDA